VSDGSPVSWHNLCFPALFFALPSSFLAAALLIFALAWTKLSEEPAALQAETAFLVFDTRSGWEWPAGF
jgi:hypothetical protein